MLIFIVKIFGFFSSSSGCYKFGDPLFGVEEGDDSLDEESGRGGDGDDSGVVGSRGGIGGSVGIGTRTGGTGRLDDDSDDQFADDEAASNQGDSSSQEYLEDHYAGKFFWKFTSKTSRNGDAFGRAVSL